VQYINYVTSRNGKKNPKQIDSILN